MVAVLGPNEALPYYIHTYIHIPTSSALNSVDALDEVLSEQVIT
jgi:hypothetical protein